MPLIEHFVYKLTGQHPDNLERQDLDPNELIATRKFLVRERISQGQRRRGETTQPDVICAGSQHYLVDGHHQARRALEEKQASITCRIFNTEEPNVTGKLERRNHGPIAQLPIR